MNYNDDFHSRSRLHVFIASITYVSIIVVIALGGIRPVAADVSAQDATPFRFVYLEFPPYAWRENGDPAQGIYIDVLKETLGSMGVDLRFEQMGWPAAQQRVRSGDADAFITVPTAERRTYTDISEFPVIRARVIIYVNAANPHLDALQKVRELSDLQDFQLINYAGNGWAHAQLQGYQVDDSFDTVDGVLKALADGSEKVFVHSETVPNYLIGKLGLGDQVIGLPLVLDTVSFHLCIGKGSPYSDLIDDFDQQIAKLKDSGRLKEIIDRYVAGSR